MWPVAGRFSAGVFVAGLAAAAYTYQQSQQQRRIVDSPKRRVLESLSPKEIGSLPYPPGVLPGGRDVPTPHGLVRVYEWGPESGAKVILVHGITTPCPALGDLGHELVRRGYRVIFVRYVDAGIRS